MNKDYEDEKITIGFKDELENDNVNDFLESIMKEFMEESFSFYKFWEELPFINTEKQLNSVLLPAIHKHTKNIWLEEPFKEKPNDKQRFLDIATQKDDNTYLIELKHAWNSRLDKFLSRTKNEWGTAIKQIADITKKSMENSFEFDNEDNVYKIALMIMPTVISLDEKHDTLNMSASKYAEDLFNAFNRDNAKKYKANFVGAIKLKNPEKYKYEYTYKYEYQYKDEHKGGTQIFPYVSFIARVESL